VPQPRGASEIRIHIQNADESLDAHAATTGGVCIYLSRRWMAKVGVDGRGRFDQYQPSGMSAEGEF
jgi:hypothetical protein